MTKLSANQIESTYQKFDRVKLFAAILIASLISAGSIALGQTLKHPRVMEMEKSLSRQALELLSGRFPGRPFLVKVSIDPMHRATVRTAESERLPYLDLSETEISDEWDDPAQTEANLMQRTKKILVSVSVPSDLSDDDTSELKATMFNNLGLFDIRDSIDISKRNWGTKAEEEKLFDLSQIILYGGFWALMMIGFFALYWFSTGRLSKALKNLEIKTKDSGASAPVSSAPMIQQAADTQRNNSPNFSNDIRFNDPIKNREILHAGVKILAERTYFPSLDEIVIIDQLGKKDTASLGALLTEFDPAMKSMLFSLSHGVHWLEALINPGEVSSAVIETINKCLRLQHNPDHEGLDELLIAVWRLRDRVEDFFKGIPVDEAFDIMGRLPKSIVLPVARKLYPGGWGRLLDSNFKGRPISLQRKTELLKRAYEISPPRNLETLVQYRNERDLVEFASTADPNVEKDIYLVSGEESLLWKIRPPFFMVLDASKEEFEKIASMFRIEDWAIAFFNLPRELRKPVEGFISEKMRIRLYEILRNLDVNPPAKTTVSQVREKIAVAFHQILHQQELAARDAEQAPPAAPAEPPTEEAA